MTVLSRTAQNTYFGPSQNPESPRPRRRKKSDLEESDYLTQAELDRLFAVIKDKRDHAMFRVAFCKALRASEIGRLQLADYNPRDNSLFIKRLKGSRSGTFPLYQKEGSALRAYLKERGNRPGPLFLSRKGRGVSRRQLDRLMKKYAALAGIPAAKRHMHVLKHTRGTHLNDAGESVVMIQHELGHRDIRNTQLYTHVSATAKAAMFERHRDKW